MNDLEFETTVDSTTGWNLARELWEEYRARPTVRRRKAICRFYYPYLERLASKLYRKIDRKVEVSELISMGFFGLVQAIEKYDPGNKVKFSTFAKRRIIGSMIDELRKFDWVPRLVSENRKKIERTIDGLSNELGHHPSDVQVAEKLSLSHSEYDNLVRAGTPQKTVSISSICWESDESDGWQLAEILPDTRAPMPFNQAAMKDFFDFVLNVLSKEDADLFERYFKQGFSQGEIARDLGIKDTAVFWIFKSRKERIWAAMKPKEDLLVLSDRG